MNVAIAPPMSATSCALTRVIIHRRSFSMRCKRLSWSFSTVCRSLAICSLRSDDSNASTSLCCELLYLRINSTSGPDSPVSLSIMLFDFPIYLRFVLFMYSQIIVCCCFRFCDRYHV